MKSRKVVLITGASSGIGAKTALTLGREGYRLVLAARRVDRLEAIAAQIRQSGGEAIALGLDLSRQDQIIQLVDKVQDHFGGIDILVNNAGSASHLWLDELSLERDITQHLQVNLVGMIQLTRLVLPGMLESGGGQIVQISSVAAWVGLPTYSIYNASKFGARGFMSGLRRELRGTNVVVSEIFPGGVDTDFAEDPRVGWQTRKVTPAFALVSSQEVADKILLTIRHRQKRSVIPWIMWLPIWADAHFPRFVSWVLSFQFYTRDGVRYSWGRKAE